MSGNDGSSDGMDGEVDLHARLSWHGYEQQKRGRAENRRRWTRC